MNRPVVVFVGTDEAAKIVGVNRATITRWAQSGRLPYLYKADGIRGPLVFNREDVERLAKGQNRKRQPR